MNLLLHGIGETEGGSESGSGVSPLEQSRDGSAKGGRFGRAKYDLK
jgi:hypothetical protein